MTLQLRCTHSLSLCWLCQIFCNPVSKFQTILHQPHHECFNNQRRSEKRDWAIANKEKISGIPPSPERISTRLLLGIKLAFKEKQSTLDSVVTLAVRDAMDSVLIPALRKQREDIKATNNSVKELREEFEAMAAAAKQTRDRIDSVQATAREDRNAVMDLRNQLKRLTEKMTDMEDKSRKNNVRLVGLPEGMEGSNVAGFLRVNLSKWIPSLKGRNIEIDWAHRMYDGRKNSDRPRTLIFRVLRWHDRLEILKGARQAYPVKCTQDNVTLLFLTLVQSQPPGEKAWFWFWGRWRRLASSPSSLIRR